MAPHALDFSSVLLITVLFFTVIAWVVGIGEMLRRWGLGVHGPSGDDGGGVFRWARCWVEGAFASGIPVFLEVLVKDVLFQRRIYRASPRRWLMHLVFLYGFVLIFILSFMSAITWFFTATGAMWWNTGLLSIMPHLQVLYEVVGYLILAGAVVMLTRRILVKDVREHSRLTDYFLPISLIIICLTGLIAEWLAGFFMIGFGEPDIPLALDFSAAHILLIFGLFGLMMPWSRYAHIITTPLTLLGRRGGGFR